MGNLFSKREFLGFIQEALRLHFILSHAIVRPGDGKWARDDDADGIREVHSPDAS